MTAHATFPQRDGAIVESFAPSIRNRAIAATKLCDAIADCNRDDAVVILEAALRDLSAGGPLPVFFECNVRRALVGVNCRAARIESVDIGQL